MWAVTKIQAQVRGLIARRQYRKLKMRVEAARLKEEEEKALRQQMDKRKAREIAEMKYLVSVSLCKDKSFGYLWKKSLFLE